MKKTFAIATIVLSALSLAACAPTTPDAQARAIAQTWLDTGQGWCGSGSGEITRTALKGGQATSVTPGGENGRWVVIDYTVESRTHHGEVGVLLDAGCVKYAERASE